jgi:STE24 endopeptidase
LRDRLQTLCRQIDLRVQDILIWKSDGMMINAAVMGITGRLRYVLLSDALLATMSPKQVEAVFAHEAGHVRHHHIPHFLMFALAAWVVVAALMEGLALVAVRAPGAGVSLGTIQSAGIIGTLVVWGIGFGWVSRRFERQADLFGARCAAPQENDCQYPCSVHWRPSVRQSAEPLTPFTDAGSLMNRNALAADGPGVQIINCNGVEASGAGGPTVERNRESAAPPDQKGRVCATGAAIFASALERVAVLNGIPREERSWRHSSIASRIRFLLSLAADPSRTAQFERVVRRTQIAMLVIGLGGSAASLVYWRAMGSPALMRLQTGDLPDPMVSPIAQSQSGASSIAVGD